MAAGVPALGHAPAAQANIAMAPIEAFAGSFSVAAGDRLDLYARNPNGSLTTAANVPVVVWRMGWPDQRMSTGTMAIKNEVVPADASANGCRSWGVAHRLSVGSAWPSGLYWAEIGSGDMACTVPFVVRPATRRTPGVKLLVQVPVTTIQAYNPYGGKSLYDYNSSGGVRGRQVSFNRPLENPLNNSFDWWQPYFVRWLAKNGIAADFCTSLDLHATANLLDGYQLLTTCGHDEYWSRTMRDRVDAFVALGGNLAVFSGNTCFWQVRFDNTGGTNRRMVCYKSRTEDPGGTAATKTTNWTDLATPYPENSTIGLAFLEGATWTNAQPRPTPPFVVQADHWVFAGTGLAPGSGFGGEFVGYETDASDFRVAANGRQYPTGVDGTPATLRILASADCSDWDARAKALGESGERPGYSMLGIFSRGGSQGTVFNAGTTDWVYGLRAELDGATPGVVSTITRNVLNKLSQAWSEPAEVRQWHLAVSGNPWSCADTLAATAPATGMVLDGAGYRAHAAAATGTVPVYRFKAVSGGTTGVRYGLGLASNMSGGWVNQGVAFHAYSSARTGTVPLQVYRATDASGLALLRYGTSTTPPAGWSLAGVLCHVLPA